MASDFEDGRTDEISQETPQVEGEELQEDTSADVAEAPEPADKPEPAADGSAEASGETSSEVEKQAEAAAPALAEAVEVDVADPEEPADEEAPEEGKQEEVPTTAGGEDELPPVAEGSPELSDYDLDATIPRAPIEVEEQPEAAPAPQGEVTPDTSAKQAAAGKLAGLLATKNGKIALAAVAAIIVVIGLFATHTICFHNWSEPTCTNPQICSKCGRTQGEPLGHEWTEATCIEPKTCERCGETKGKALGHDVKTWKTTKEATCTAKGEEQGKCTRCNEVQTRAIEMKDHEFGKWETTKEATCTEEGVATRKCKNCDETETKTIAKTDHTPGDWEIETPAKPDGEGGTIPGTRVRKCTVCGEVLEQESYEMSAEELFESFAAECQSPSYDDVARNPDNYEGSKVKFQGEVVQVMQDGDAYTMRVDVTNNGYFWTDTIMVYYVAGSGDPRILEDDIITMYGTMAGMYSYESVMGATITVPLMFATYVRY